MVDSYPTYGIGFTLSGIVMMAGDFIIQMQRRKNITLELLVAFIASICLGFGGLFLMLSFNLYV